MGNMVNETTLGLDGILVVDKTAGVSSARAVGQVKRLLPRGSKIGHAGTLDPFATGVLLLLIGKATKLCESMMDQRKQYQASILFGATTATDDPESDPQIWLGLTEHTPPPDLSDVNSRLPLFQGQIVQTPPAFSALKIGGRRAYQLARGGAMPVMTARTVNVYSIETINYAWPVLQIRVDCGRGTYIRALARDIGAALNVGGHLTQLRRTRIGPFSIDQAAVVSELTTENLQEKIIPLEQARAWIGG
jgi:tRNA pseudouridine55 synthase